MARDASAEAAEFCCVRGRRILETVELGMSLDSVGANVVCADRPAGVRDARADGAADPAQPDDPDGLVALFSRRRWLAGRHQPAS